MRRPGWLEGGRESPARRLALLPLDALAALYGVGATLHRAWYTRGPGRPTRLACRVVSVGNLVVGGSGKTPTAAWVARSLRTRGHRVVLASRGYGGRGADGVEVVSDGRFVRGRAERVGDEPMWLAAEAPGVPVLVGRHRDAVGFRAVAAFGAEILVLDDGFQHHRLLRDVDLVTVQGAAGLGNGRVLPRGPLREPVRGLARAHALLVVDGPLATTDEARIARVAPGLPRFSVRRTPDALRPLAGGARSAAETLRGRPVGMLCGLARPAAFRATLEGLGARIVAERSFPDHHRYGPQDLQGLSDDAPLWVTTEKDAGKLLPRWVGGAEVRVLHLDTRVEEGDAFLDWLEARLRPRPAGRDAALPGG